MVEKNYVCGQCGDVSITEGMNAPIPECCGKPMNRDWSSVAINCRNGTLKNTAKPGHPQG